MTRFVSDAIGVRSGGGSRGPTKAQRAKALEEYQRTGRHPELEREREAGPSGLALPARLPAPLLTRPHVFLDIEGGGTKYRLVVELFNDTPSARAAATAFAARCRPGADGAFVGSPLAGIAPNTALFGGGRAPARGVVAPTTATAGLTHCEPGTVSLSTRGGSWAVALEAAPSLDSPAWAVCGRLTGASLGAAAALGRLEVRKGASDAGPHIPTGALPPVVPHAVRGAGVTDARGRGGEGGECGDGGDGGDGAPVELGAGVEAALQASLQGKVDRPSAAPGGGKKRGLDELLGGGGESDESGSEESG